MNSIHLVFISLALGFILSSCTQPKAIDYQLIEGRLNGKLTYRDSSNQVRIIQNWIDGRLFGDETYYSSEGDIIQILYHDSTGAVKKTFEEYETGSAYPEELIRFYSNHVDIVWEEPIITGEQNKWILVNTPEISLRIISDGPAISRVQNHWTITPLEPHKSVNINVEFACDDGRSIPFKSFNRIFDH